MLRELQEGFRRSVLEGDDGRLKTIIAGDGVGPDRRLAIYRNNTFGSLIGVLAAAFPVVARLVGDRFFRFAAREYIAAHPPHVPQLLAYGDAFADFLDTFPAAATVPYLGDVARLEWARNEALFAADADPLDPAALECIPADRYAELRFVLHPAVRLVTSRFPVLAIWQANQAHNETVPPVARDAGGQHVLVSRPGLRVDNRTVGAGEFALLTCLSRGAMLAEAAEEATALESGLDLQIALASHFRLGTFCDVTLT